MLDPSAFVRRDSSQIQGCVKAMMHPRPKSDAKTAKAKHTSVVKVLQTKFRLGMVVQLRDPAKLVVSTWNDAHCFAAFGKNSWG